MFTPVKGYGHVFPIFFLLCMTLAGPVFLMPLCKSLGIICAVSLL